MTDRASCIVNCDVVHAAGACPGLASCADLSELEAGVDTLTCQDASPAADLEQPQAEQASDRIWEQLTPDLAHRVVAFLPACEVATTLRLVCRAAAAQFKAAPLRLSQPGGLPHHAFAWRWGPAGGSGHGASARNPTGLLSSGIRSLTLSARRCLLELTAAGGDVCNLALAASVAGCGLPPGALEAALEGGHLAAATWLLDKGCPMEPGNLVGRCAKGGSVQALRWLLARPEMSERAGVYLHLPAALQTAARAGHGEVCTALMDWVAGMAAEGNTRAAELIANGLWHVARRMAPVEAAAGGHARLMQVLLAGVPTAETGTDWQRLLLKAVAGGCDLATLRKVHAVVCASLRGPSGAPPLPRAPAGPAAAGGRGRGRGGRAPGAGPQPDVVMERARQRREQEVEARQAHMGALAAAARSTTPDWRAKVEWLLAAMGRAADSNSNNSSDGGSGNVYIDDAAALPDAEERMRWLRARGFRLGRQALPEAVRQCETLSVEALRYLLQLVAGQDWPLLGTHAPPLAAAGRLDLLKVLLEAAGSPPPPPPGQQVQQPQQADAAMATATAHGDAAAMGAAVAAATAMPPGGGNGTVAREARWPSVSLGTVRALLLAAAPGGHLEVIRWLLALGQSFFPKDAQPEGLEAGSGASRGAQSGSGGCGAAAAAGSRSGSSSSDGYSPSKLALYGVLNSDLFCAAVRSGSVQLLELLRGAGCTWDPLAVWEAAAETGCCDVLHWLFMQGWPLPANDVPYLRAARNADELTICTLRNLGYTWAPGGETLARAVYDARGSVPLAGLVALVAAGCPADWAALLHLAQRYRNYGYARGQESEVLAWAREHMKKEQQAKLAEERRAASKKGNGSVERTEEAAEGVRGGSKGKGRKGRKGRGHRRGASDSSEDEEEAPPGAAGARARAAAPDQ